MLDFTSLVVGKEYDREYLTKLWGYGGHQALDRGVITPKNENNIILFITKGEQSSLTQYANSVERDILYWEGERGHRTDRRITMNKDVFHIFYRDKHRSPFIYNGKAILLGSRLRSDKPSEFKFQLIDQM